MLSWLLPLLITAGISLAGSGGKLTGEYNEVEQEPQLLENEHNTQAVEALENLAYGEMPTLDTLELAGLTPEEQNLLNMGMGLLSDFSTDPYDYAGYAEGMEEIKNTLSGDYNPEDSTYWAGYQNASELEEQNQVANLRRSSQLGGMLYSEPRMREEVKGRTDMSNDRMQTLGGLFDKERDRMSMATNSALNYATFDSNLGVQKMQGIGALAPLAGKRNDIRREEQMFNTNVANQQALLPYQYQMPAMESLSNYGTYYTNPIQYEPGAIDLFAGLAPSAMDIGASFYDKKNPSGSGSGVGGTPVSGIGWA